MVQSCDGSSKVSEQQISHPEVSSGESCNSYLCLFNDNNSIISTQHHSNDSCLQGMLDDSRQLSCQDQPSVVLGELGCQCSCIQDLIEFDKQLVGFHGSLSPNTLLLVCTQSARREFMKISSKKQR